MRSKCRPLSALRRACKCAWARRGANSLSAGFIQKLLFGQVCRVRSVRQPSPSVALCLGPSEWLAIAETLSLPSLRSGAFSAESGLIAVDVTCAIALLELRGSGARDLLSGGCGIDFDLRRFAIGRCCRTRLAMIAVVIDHVGENAYNLYCACSYLAYMRSWLSDKSRYLKP